MKCMQGNISVYSTRKESSANNNSSFKKDESEFLTQEPQKYWEVTDHCNTLLFPQPWPDILFDNPSSNYHYQRQATTEVPEQEFVRRVTNAHLKVLARLNQSKLQVRNFILPVQLIKMKHMDPSSRHKVIEELSKFFSFQRDLRNIVLEQAEVKFVDLCYLLLGIASNTKIKALYLWHVLDGCDKPFRGPLQSDEVLDDLPRIPFTYNPGGRKYLRDLKNAKHLQREESIDSFVEACLKFPKTQKTKMTLKSIMSCFSTKYSVVDSATRKESKDFLTQISAREDMVKLCFNDSSDNITCKLLKREFDEPEYEEHVFSQAEVGIQCHMSQDFEPCSASVKKGGDCRRPTLYTVESVASNNMAESSTLDNKADLLLKKTRLRICSDYLKYYKNTKIRTQVLQEVYKLALNSLTNLTKVSLNYCMIADGTGSALLSIGSIANGKLRHLKLLCEPDDIPSRTHELYNDKALQAIPDLIWLSVQKDCPDLKVHVICVSMSAYHVTKRFVTRSMPLCSFHMENGFCPSKIGQNMNSPQLNISCILKCLWLNHADTLEHVNITLWNSTERFESSLEKLIRQTSLISFMYHGSIQFKDTINKLCDAALLSREMKLFKLMIQGDPCFPHIARELTCDLYNHYQLRFQDKSIKFMLGTINS